MVLGSRLPAKQLAQLLQRDADPCPAGRLVEDGIAGQQLERLLDGRMLDAPVVERARNVLVAGDAIAARKRGETR